MTVVLCGVRAVDILAVKMYITRRFFAGFNPGGYMEPKNLKTPALRDLAREKGVAGYAAMNRAELLSVLEKSDKPTGKSAETVAKKTSPSSKSNVKKTAKSVDLSVALNVTTAEVESVDLEKTKPVPTPVSVVEPVMPAIPEENLGVLPENYDEDRIVVVPRDPEWTWVHWQLSDSTRKNGFAIVPGGQTVLRVVLENDRGGSTVFEHGIDDGVTRWYVRVGGDDRFVSVEVGLRGGEDRYVLLIRSRRTPLAIARLRPGEARFLKVDPDVSLRALRARGDLPTVQGNMVPGRILSEVEFRALFGIPEPASQPF